MDWLPFLLIPAVLMALGVGLWAWALLLPVHRLTSRSVQLPQPPDLVWAVLTDFATHPAWRQDLVSTSEVPTADGTEVWREVHRRFAVTLRTQIEESGRVLERRSVGVKLDFSGSWRFELAPQGRGTRLTIIESAEIYRPLHRLYAACFLGRGRQIEGFQRDLARALGRTAPVLRAEPAIA